MSQFDPQVQTQQQQPPVAVYPNTVTRQPPSSSSSSSSDNGSFGTVFIVLAVIIVISGIACCLGRLCNKRVHKNKPPKHSHNFRSKDRVKEKEPRERERDLEFGFDKNIAASKPAGKGEAPNGFCFKMPEKGQHVKFEPRVRGSNGPGKSFKISSHEDGDIKFEPNKFGDFGHPKASG